MRNPTDLRTGTSGFTHHAERPFLSVIVPFFDDPALPHLRQRIDDLCHDLSALSHIEVIVVEGQEPIDSGTGWLHSEWQWTSIRHVKYVNDKGGFALAAARNLGAQCASGVAIAFCDVDLRFPGDFWSRLLQYCAAYGIGRFKRRYFCVPCLYLTERGTREFLSAHPDTRTFEFLIKWLNGDSESIEILAPCTSFIVIDRLYFLSQGGYSRVFVGHGFEDFELYHRLASDANAFDRPDDYYRDLGDWSQREYRGFRSLFSLTGRGPLFGNLLAVHLWHERPPRLRFYHAKQENHRRLTDAMTAFDATGKRPSPLAALETRYAPFMFLGDEHSHAANTLRDVFPLLGEPRYVDEGDFVNAAGMLNERALADVLTTTRSAKVLFRNPYRTPARQALYRWCRETAFPYVVFERGGLPNTWFFDSRGFNADSASYSRTYWDRPLTPTERQHVLEYMRWSHAGHETLERQGDRIGVEPLAVKLGVVGKRVLFVPLQRPSDTVTVHMAGVAMSVGRFLAFIDQLADHLRRDGWAVICKRHPYESDAPPLRCATYVDPETNILDLVGLADAVALMNSSVGLYAMMMEKPCYIFAHAFYAFEGINETVAALDVHDVRERVCAGSAVDMEAVYRFVRYLTQEFYSFGRASYLTWREDDGAFRKAATSIDFTEIRVPGMPARVYRTDEAGQVPFGAPIYERFHRP